MKKNNQQYKTDTYTTKYFEERDNLDLRMAETLKLLLQKHGLKKVLDVGCGTGLLVKYLMQNNFEAVGCDNEKQAIQTAKKKNKVNIIHASATKLPFKKNSFDIVTSISVIEHLTPEDVEIFIQEAKRVLKPTGLIFIVTPNYATPIRLWHGKKWFGYSDPTHINFYTPKSLAKVLKIHGFKRIQTHFKTKVDLPFDWDLPEFFRKLPKPLIHLITFLLVSTIFSNIRNSFWMAGTKYES